MNPIAAFFKLFKKEQPSEEDKERNRKWVEGYHAYEQGKKHWLASAQPGGEREYKTVQTQEALECFDKAIECGFYEDSEIYGLRGSCLQLLGYHADAIDDFNAAIQLKPEDCNTFFERSLSRGATCDYDGEISDLQEAIRLSQENADSNVIYNTQAKELGYENAGSFYRLRLMTATLSLKYPDSVKERIRAMSKPRRATAIRTGQETARAMGETIQIQLGKLRRWQGYVSTHRRAAEYLAKKSAQELHPTDWVNEYADKTEGFREILDEFHACTRIIAAENIDSLPDETMLEFEKEGLTRWVQEFNRRWATARLEDLAPTGQASSPGDRSRNSAKAGCYVVVLRAFFDITGLRNRRLIRLCPIPAWPTTTSFFRKSGPASQHGPRSFALSTSGHLRSLKMSST